MNRFYVIGLDDNMKQYFPPEVLEIISSHRVFSGGVRHHEIVRSLLPEKRTGLISKSRWTRSSIDIVRMTVGKASLYSLPEILCFRIRRYDSKPIAGCANPPVPVI